MDHTRQFSDYDIECRGRCEYCTDDAFYVDDLLRDPTDGSTIDPREAVLDGNLAELYVEKVIDIKLHKQNRKSLHKKGKL